jgi:hypothetical protein
MDISTHQYLSKDDAYKLIETFIADNNLDAWWMSDDEGYLALGIVTKLKDESWKLTKHNKPPLNVSGQKTTRARAT